MKFNRLTVLEIIFETNNKNKTIKKARVQCDCGTIKIVKYSYLKNGHTKSCGCYIREISAKRLTTHNRSKSSTYSSWRSMKKRCLLKTSPNYHLYGGAGISIDKKWLSFENFLKDMGERPPNTSLDRKNTFGNYCKKNCRWADKHTQANNKTNNHYILFKNKKQTLTEWCRQYKISPQTVNARMKGGMSIEEALTTPINKQKSHGNTRRENST
jgi:hypothetical protein